MAALLPCPERWSSLLSTAPHGHVQPTHAKAKISGAEVEQLGQSLRRAIRRVRYWLPPAVQEAARAARWEMARIRNEGWYLDRGGQQEFFRRAFSFLQINGIDGVYAEFGCWTGTTFVLAYRESRNAGMNCKLWAFDSFSGLPAPKVAEDEYPHWREGALCTTLDEFHEILRRNRIPVSAYEVVPGYYEQTLAGEGSHPGLPSNICLAYLDCDLYSSAKTVLDFLLPRLKHGMILACDDYYCYSKNQVPGERRACGELLAAHPDWRLVPYIQYGWSGMSFIVESKQLNCPKFPD